MGNCCSYGLKLSQGNSIVDPLNLNEIQLICESEIKNNLSEKGFESKKNKESLPKNNGLILTTTSFKQKPNILEKPKANIAKLQNLKVETPKNFNSSKSVESNPQPKVNSLNQDDNLRKDFRAFTARIEDEIKVVRKLDLEVLNLKELKINEEILKKISRLNIIASKKELNEKGDNSLLRSQTQGNENNLFDDVFDGTGTHNTIKTIKKEEIKQDLIETKEILEKIKTLEKKPSKVINKPEEEKIKEIKETNERSISVDKQIRNESPLNEGNLNKSVVLPRKSLLKKYKTIGDDGKREKSKKKVKFKDLFDSHGKKKVRRVKK